MDRDVTCVVRLLSACVNGGPTSVRCHLPALLRVIVPLFISPLTSPRVTRVFDKLKDAAFDSDSDNNYFREYKLNLNTIFR